MKPQDEQREAMRRLLAFGEDDAPLDMLEELPPVEALPAWTEPLIERARAGAECPPTPAARPPSGGADAGDEPEAPRTAAGGRVLRFPRRAVIGTVTALAAAAVLLVWFGRTPTVSVPVETGAITAPVAEIVPSAQGGSAFVGDRAGRWAALELGYRFEAVADWETSPSADARFEAVRLRGDLAEFAHRWVQGRAIAPDALIAGGSKADRLAAARAALDGPAAEGFELGRWLYLLARHRAGAGPPPPAASRNVSALSAWVGASADAPLRAALDALADDPSGAPVEQMLARLVGVGEGRQ